MTLTPVAFESDRHCSDPAGEMLVNVVVVSPNDVLTPCVPAGVRRFGVRLKKRKYSGGWWQCRTSSIAPRNIEPTEPTARGLPSTPEDEAWVDQSWSTLRGWMAENEE